MSYYIKLTESFALALRSNGLHYSKDIIQKKETKGEAEKKKKLENVYK